MQKKLSKVLTILFLIIFIFQIIGLMFLLIAPKQGQAIDKLDLQVDVGETTEIEFKESTSAIADYIKAIYKYSLGIVGILATVVMMFGGMLWITAGGNAERITNAKSWITASLTGLIIALTSYMILFIVNPDLVNFKVTEISNVKQNGCCEKIKNSDTGGNTTQNNCESGWKGEDYNWTGSECKEDIRCDSDKITYNLICLNSTTGNTFNKLGYDCQSSSSEKCDGQTISCSATTAKFCCSNAPCTK